VSYWLGGVKQARWAVNSTEYAAYKWNGYWNGSDKIDVVYVDGDGAGGTTADLYVDSVKVNNFTLSTVDASTFYYEGAYSTVCFDNPNLPRGQVQLSAQSALRFPISVAQNPQAQPLARMLGYDYCNRVTSIDENGQVSTYGYNPSGQRVTKVEGTPATTTYYFFANYELEVTAGQQTQILYYGQEKLLYIHKDHLGSAVRLTDTQGAVVQSLAYDPFGFTVYSGGISEPSNQYTGQKKDGSGLYYYGARYYDPELGRFISPDTVLDGLNRYAYCGNNPINYVDPTGNTWVPNGGPGPYPYTWVPDPDPQPTPGDVNTSETTKASPKENPSGNTNTKPAVKSDPGESSGINGIDIIPPAPMPDEKINRNDPDPRTIGNTDPTGPNVVIKEVSVFYPGSNFGVYTAVPPIYSFPSTGSGVLDGVKGTGISFMQLFLDWHLNLPFSFLRFINEGGKYGPKKMEYTLLEDAALGWQNGGYNAFITGRVAAMDVVGAGKSATTPIGRRGNPLEVISGTNSPSTINGRTFTGHALDQMQGRGIMPSVVENTIKNGVATAGNTIGTFAYTYDTVKVIVNAAGDVVTVIPR
jgi:RHS repeat-associated protein